MGSIFVAEQPPTVFLDSVTPVSVSPAPVPLVSLLSSSHLSLSFSSTRNPATFDFSSLDVPNPFVRTSSSTKHDKPTHVLETLAAKCLKTSQRFMISWPVTNIPSHSQTASGDQMLSDMLNDEVDCTMVCLNLCTESSSLFKACADQVNCQLKAFDCW